MAPFQHWLFDLWAILDLVLVHMSFGTLSIFPDTLSRQPISSSTTVSKKLRSSCSRRGSSFGRDLDPWIGWINELALLFLVKVLLV